MPRAKVLKGPTAYQNESSPKMPHPNVFPVGKGHESSHIKSSSKMLRSKCSPRGERPQSLLDRVKPEDATVKLSLRGERPRSLPERVWTPHDDEALQNLESELTGDEQATRRMGQQNRRYREINSEQQSVSCWTGAASGSAAMSCRKDKRI